MPTGRILLEKLVHSVNMNPQQFSPLEVRTTLDVGELLSTTHANKKERTSLRLNFLIVGDSVMMGDWY